MCAPIRIIVARLERRGVDARAEPWALVATPRQAILHLRAKGHGVD
jgi:hypothetical protein